MTLRLGTGAGYSGSRVEPALEIAQSGDVSYLIFECLGERTIAIAQNLRREGRGTGFDPYLEWRMPRVLEACLPRDIRIVSNMGAANPDAAGLRIRELVGEMGLKPVRIGVIHGDDALDVVRSSDAELDTGARVSELGDRLVSASAYIGAEPIVEALQRGARIVIGGRIADPSLFLGPMRFEFGWGDREWSLLGAGTLVGHLLECSAQVTGGYFADPGYQEVDGLESVGFPIAEVEPTGEAVITKVAGSGGLVSVATCAEQVLYEVGDPTAYLTPDVTADFSNSTLAEVGRDRVRVRGGSGRPAPDKLKVAVGYLDGFIGEGAISYGGPGALARARLAGEIIQKRLALIGLDVRELCVDVIGWDSLYGRSLSDAEPGEVRLRIAGKTSTREEADEIGHEVEALYGTGPAGGGGVGRSVKEVLAIGSCYIPRKLVTLEVEIL